MNSPFASRDRRKRLHGRWGGKRVHSADKGIPWEEVRPARDKKTEGKLQDL